MQTSFDVEKNFKKLAKEIESFNEKLKRAVPRTIIKEVSTFGNSSHVVLPKEFLDKTVGIIVLENDKKMKGGGE